MKEKSLSFMNDNLSDQQIEAILSALNDAIDNGPWEESSFLRAVNKSLCEIRNNFLEKVQASRQQPATHLEQIQERSAPRPGYQSVYVGLYSSDGFNIHSWERIIYNLPRQIVSRPIYEDEENIKAIIRTKENKLNEGYVAIFIKPDDILQLGYEKAPIDKLGKTLLTLKDKSIILSNIQYFVHETGTYHYSHGRLTKV